MTASPRRSSRPAPRAGAARSVGRRGLWGRAWRTGLAVPATVALALGGVLNAPAAMAASSVTSAVFAGGAGTVSQGGTLYAKQGGAVTLNVVTSTDTKCVDVAGAFSGHQDQTTAKSNWSFTVPGGAPAGDGAQSVTVTASDKTNGTKCTGITGSTQASYTLDNSGPVVTAALTSTPNPAGWNNTDTTVKWTATDAGSGVAAAQPFQTDSVTANGIVTKTAPAQADRLGNTGAGGSVTVRVDKASPTISASQVKNADGTTTVTFTCDDSNSGGQQSSGIASCLAEGSTTNSKTVGPNTTVTGTAIDNAGNKSTTSSTAPAGDTTPPSLSGAPTTSANANGWYKNDVTIHWTCSDSGSGIAGSCPANSTISSEGQLLYDTKSVSDIAGNSTTASSSPKVHVDKTAPTTGLSGNSNNWVNGAVNVTLAPHDNLSGIASTSYSIDGGPAQSGTSVSLSAEGDHTVSFFSTDKAGNVEAAQTVHVKIDKTAPTIGHSFTPSSYTDGAWTNQSVTVTFQCADQGGSGVASCTGGTTKTTEGEGQQVVGTATDGAGNTATNTAVVSIDKTAPSISASADRAANAAGWYNDDVTVSFTANDALSGVASKTTDKVLGQGDNQSASGTATDKAGNSASDSVFGINIDKTAPVLTGTFSSGWHTDDVTVNWTCTDTGGSGVKGTQPSDTTVTGEGDNLSSSASCEDVAGNTVTKTVTGIRIDRTNPTTQAKVAPPNGDGWYGDAVQVTLSTDDNLSGVASTKYSVDGGAAQSYDGAFSFGTEGEHTISFWSTDVAGNTETAGAPITLKIDKKAPITTVINPMSPDTGWFVTSGVPFAFDANDSGSGIKATYYMIDGGATQTYGEPFTADLSTGKHTFTYWSVDLAGNKEAVQDGTIAVDTIAPTITGSRTPAANSFGWNNTNVDVTFECSDADSGIDGVVGCGPDQTVASEGLNQHVQGDAQDIAGNKSSTTVDKISIDKTSPSLLGDPTTDANGAGWYKGSVSIAWTGDDGLSGIDSDTQPANSVITAEGHNLGASASIFDKAGNKGTGSVSGINIDRTAPSITGNLPAGKNAAGWYRGDVTVGFTCSDPALADGTAGSGVANCPSDKVLSGDGANQSVTSDTATDDAGNVRAGKTVSGINIDGHEPQSTADNKCTSINGYCTGDTATVVLNATDVGPSGVKEIHYTVNGGTEQVAAGASKSVSVPLSGTGTATVKYYAVDVAGNTEPSQQVVLKYDNIAPTVTHTVTPKANAADWNKSNVTVHFDATDTDPGSGVVSVTPDQVISDETAGLLVTGSAKDAAGNTGTDSVTIKLDKTAPSIDGAIVSGTMGSNGWYVSEVGVHFTCSDSLSGLAACADDVTLTGNGANQSVTRTATDNAGNIGSTTVSGISIDNENPSITDVNVAGGFYKLGAAPTPTCTATDSFSGLLSCKVAVTGGTNGVGTFNWTATATDKAGNTSTQTGTYKVTYRFDGFLQPINDTAHQIGTSISVFKGGSTVPVKFQLKNANGAVVQSTSAPVWLAPVKGSSMSMPVDESVYSASADSGSTYRYDATAQQYIYNWKTTPAGGSYYRIGVKLDDGQTYYVNIGLR